MAKMIESKWNRPRPIHITRASNAMPMTYDLPSVNLDLPRLFPEGTEITFQEVDNNFTHINDRLNLVVLLKSINPKTIVEIGINSGLTAKLLLLNLPNIEHYIGIDVTPGYEFTVEGQKGEVPSEPGVHVKDDPRVKLLVFPKGSLGLHSVEIGECDAMFIDGDHSWEAVFHDTLLAMQCVRRGGFIIWHDYRNVDETSKCLDEMYHLGMEIYSIDTTTLAFSPR